MSDPTDPGGVGAAQAERASSRYARVGDNGSPVGSPLTIILAVVAVVVGFLIFRTIDGGGGNAGGLPDTDITIPTPTDAQGNTVVTQAPGSPTTAAPPTTAAVTRTGATVVVVNAAGIGGVAGDMTEKLAALTYTMEGEGITSNAGAIDTTVVYYNAGTGNPATLAVAQALANDLGVGPPQEVPDPFPSDDSTGAATVFVMLGTDLAGKDLPTATTAPTVNTPAPTTTTAA
jgi:hypothetical protein